MNLPVSTRHFETHARMLLAGVLMLCVTISTFFGIRVEAASAPNIISYQGRLLNTNGVPVAPTSASMVFEFYTAAVLGSCVWSNSSSTCASATARTVTLTDGLFSENLGDTSLGAPYAAITDSVFGSNAALYLQVTVNGETLTPRKAIVAAPYALNGDTLDGLDSDDDGATAAAIAAFNSTGNLVVTGNPSSSGVSGGSLYINPASGDTAADDTLFGVAVSGTEEFRIDREGDLSMNGDVTLTTTSPLFDFIDSTAGDEDYGINIDADVFSLYNTTTADTFISFSGTTTPTLTLLGAGSSTRSILMGGTGVISSSDTISIATGATGADTITIGNSNASTTMALTGGDDWSIGTGGAIASVGDITLTSTSPSIFLTDTASTDFSINVVLGGLDITNVTSGNIEFFINAGGPNIDLGNSTTDNTINIGGVAESATNIVRVATNSTEADTITVGNSNAATTIALTGGTSWSVTTGGLITSASDLALNGGDLTSTSATFNFLDASGNSSTLDVGGVTTDLGNTINIATNSTTADAVTVGNSNAATTIALTGGDDWSIAATGDGVFEDLTIDLNGTATTNGVCHSGADSDTTATAREVVVCSAAPDDYAEWYETDGSAVAGDVVAVTDSFFTYEAKQSNPFTGEILPGSVTKTLPILTKADVNDGTVFGIVSTSPNQTIGSDVKHQGSHPLPIGLVGRVPLHVTSENGPIAAGDYLTLSSTPGYAMKATRPGRVIGRALANFDGVGLTTITAYIDNSWYGGAMLAEDGSAQSAPGDLHLSALATASPALPVSDSHALLLSGSAWDGSSATDVTMGLRTRVATPSDYELAIENRLGGTVASITNSGDILVSGRLYPSDRGLTQTSAYIFYDSSAGDGYIKTNAAGWNVGSYDFAEMFPSDDALIPGDVVVFGNRNEAVKKSPGETYDPTLVGVVSTRPGFLAGEYTAGSYPIALAGRVPTHVSAQNGAIAIGDALTTSSIPGVAMKATEAGPILGYAMEPFTEGEGTIIAFIRASHYGGSGVNVAPDVDNTVSGMTTGSNLDISGVLNMNGGNILSVGSLEGIGGAWIIAENGDFTTKGVITQKLPSHQGGFVDTHPILSTEQMVELSGTATLTMGSVAVSFDEIIQGFNDSISNTASYRVLVTPQGITGQVYVTDRSNGGFVIRDSAGSTGVLVDWLVLAYPKDYVEPVSVPELAEEEVPTVLGDTDVMEPPIVIDTVTEEVLPEPVIDEPVLPEPEPEMTPLPPEEPVTEPSRDSEPDPVL